MKFRIASVLVLLMVFAVALSFAQTKKDCPVTPTCCQKGSTAEKASLSSKAVAQDAKFLAVSDKGEKSKAECKDMKNCDKKECPMMKGEKTSMKSDSKDCCKDGKTTKSKAKAKKSVEKQESDAKGTN